MSVTERSVLHAATRRPVLVPDPRVQSSPEGERRRTRRIKAPLLRFGVLPLLLGVDILAGVAAVALLGNGLVDLVLVAVLLPLFATANLYRSRLSLSVIDDLPRLLGRWLAALPVTVGLQALLTGGSGVTLPVHTLLVGSAAIAGVIALRAAAYALVRALRSSGAVAHRTLVVGAGKVGAQVVNILREHPEYGLHPVGFVDSRPLLSEDELRVPLLGGVDDLTDVLLDSRAHNVVLAFAHVRESQMVHVLRTCDRFSCEVFMVPRLFELHPVSEDMDAVWGLPLVRLRRAPYRTVAWRVKRAVDVALSAIAVTALAPLLAATAVAVRLEGGPGVLFRQERVGVDGRRFRILKFRSLKPASELESSTTWNISQDHRLGPVGRFIRKTSIDELPQLFNILRGDMSIVGPRPERPHFVAQFHQTYPSYMARHRVPSGLTGWAQVNGLRGNTSIADRARFDNYYIENWSLWLDLKIVLRTVWSVLRGAGG